GDDAVDADDASNDAGDDAGDDASDDASDDAIEDASEDAGGGCGEAGACGGACTDLSTDARNCGGCGHDCTALAGVDPALVRCVAGACEAAGACLPGRGHCTATPDDGCETDFTQPA